MAANDTTFNELILKSGIVILDKNDSGNPVITDIFYDSRSVVPGSLYVAIPGTKQHGDQYIDAAITRGAAAVVSANSHPEISVPWIKVENPRVIPGIFARELWNVNRQQSLLVGITGTNGKTTVAHLYESLFTMRLPAEKVWMFGTIDYHVAGKRIDATHTTPEALQVIKNMGSVDDAPGAVIMEVSSHSLALDRVAGLEYDLAVFTNLTQDHLDYHLTMESYFEAKLRLFTEFAKSEACAVVNIDDAFGSRIAKNAAVRRCITYGRKDSADCRIVGWECTWQGTSVTIEYIGAVLHFKSGLRGFFNVYNMAALIAGGLASGFDADTIQAAFDRVPVVHGRMERVLEGAPFTVVVDYAHTPDALLNVLRTSKELTKGRLLCVFGCGGDRDRAKRPLMGKAVADLCDEAWVTSDNPRSEDPMRIIGEIIEGIPLDFPYQVNPDRRMAIASVIAQARRDDCIVIAGKGHETYQEIAGVKHHFDDSEEVEAAYRTLIDRSITP